MIVLIPTCAKYSDITPYFVHFFDKYWLDCPYRKIFINGSIFPGFENFQTPDKGWAQNILTFIELEKTNEHILLLHDDYLLMQNISTNDVEQANADITTCIGSIRLIIYSDNEYNCGYGWKWPSHISYNDLYNYADLDIEYKQHGGFTRLPWSHQPAIWNVNVLKKYLNPAWSPWQHEIFRSREICDKEEISSRYNFITTKDNLFLYCNGIRDGKYSQEFIDLIKDMPFIPHREIAKSPSKLDKEDLRLLTLRQIDGTYPPRPIKVL